MIPDGSRPASESPTRAGAADVPAPQARPEPSEVPLPAPPSGTPTPLAVDPDRCLTPHELRPADPPDPDAACPDPKACTRFALFGGDDARGWRPDPGGRALVEFVVNATPPAGTSITPEEIEGAAVASMRTWAGASPALCFVYEGRTDREPVLGDGVTTVAWGSSVRVSTDGEGFITEADVERKAVRPTDDVVWAPCAQADDSCEPLGKRRVEAQDRLTHELGHLVGLDDLDERGSEGMTMWSPGSSGLGGRHRVTLGLGDVLGVRELYPCGCPLPPVYRP